MSGKGSGAEAQVAEIVLVEDERADVLLLQRALRRGGLTNPLRVLSDGEKALDYLLARAHLAAREDEALPALILLDLKLPRLDGLSVLRRLKQVEIVRRVPVVVLTSSARPQDIRQAYDLGANSYLVKPPRFSDLCDLTDRVKGYWLDTNYFADGGTV